MLNHPQSHSGSQFPIVGIGASAGGLEAFSQLLQVVPPDTGLAFVLVQHLDRTHASLLPEALAKTTAMPVRQAEQGMRVEPNHVYVIAPNTDIAIENGALAVSLRASDSAGAHLPVDFFLRSLAAQLGSRAIGVILSGSASDGTEGLRAIREADGITFAQDPRSARFASMPQSAIAAGVVDYTLGIDALGGELARLSRDPYVQLDQPDALDTDEPLREELFARVRSAIGVDFRDFKRSTVNRRIARRIALRRMGDLRSYLKLLDAEPEEIRALFEDMLIHVTSFFRDAEMFDLLRTHVFPEISKHKPDGIPVRIWVAGCSTGEEVYSIAIAWHEFAADTGASHQLQVFGSDLSEVAIGKARLGIYSDSAMQGVSDERRVLHFSRLEGGQRVHEALRDVCMFVRHDLLRDPPFSKLDLISTRNVLIYFDQDSQHRVLATLHYCLNQPGFLVLGRSENASAFSHLFSRIDATSKVFARNPATNTQSFPLQMPATVRPAGAALARPSRANASAAALAKHFDRLLLSRYGPAGVLINGSLEVLLFRGGTGAYLQAAPGQPQSNLIAMARGGLVAPLRDTIAQAKRDKIVVRRPRVEVDQDGGSTKLCDVVVVPFAGLPDTSESHLMVLFEEASAQVTAVDEAGSPDEWSASADRRRSERLELELAATKDYVHTLIEEHGQASDELEASNKELISGNEELQSMNEQLETAKEELQSINEELTTLNDELQTRNLEVSQANSDLMNFALAVDIPIVTLDTARRVRRLTPKACSVLNMVATDVGRRIDDLELNVIVPELAAGIEAVRETGTMRESEVKDKSGRWHRMQIRPHVTADRSVDGVLLSFVDIDGLKQLIAEAQQARTEAERANAVKDEFLATLSHELRTPLASMLLNAQQIRNGQLEKRAELQHAGESLERATLLQVKLVDDLLDISRIVAGKLTLDMSAVSLREEIQVSIETVSALIGRKGLVLELNFDPEMGLIWADRMRTRQIVSNLLTNAIKFTPRGGRLTVTVEMTAGFARLSVTDTGIGIDREFVPHVFTRFSQRDSSITRRYGGLGLGLALVRHLAELQGGSVEARSEGEGHGSTFCVTFPVLSVSHGNAVEPVAREFRALERRPGREKDYAALVGLRVLIVDDDKRTREAVGEVLELAGAHTERASSAAEGLLAVDTFKPQVILCDIAMPNEDGYAFVSKLRLKEGASSIPALALTALAAQDDRRRALAAGFQLHLAKPIDIDRLRDAVLQLAHMENGRTA
jgi:chemotaxis methyl-accepting protein methylase/signal transduction histidine kinase/chemotaxis response regulator CheB